MESKKTFGSFILQRRRTLGLTQKEFARQLYVTESAVSKWERGLSYPDITILRDICRILQITEHELLTGNEDTQQRASERLAQKYLRFMRSFRLTQYILYGLTLIGCAIGNLCANGRLDWFWIVLFSVATSASLTLLPAILSMHAVRMKALIVLAAFTCALLLLLGACCLYTGGSWFFVAATSVLFGLTLFFLYPILRRLYLPEALEQRRLSLYLLAEMLLLTLLFHTSCIFTGEDWFLIATVSTLVGLLFFLLPIFLRQIPVRRHRPLLYFAVQTTGLLGMLFIIDRYTGQGLFLSVGLPVTASVVSLAWAIMLCTCYIPANRFLKASASCACSALWCILWPSWFERRMTTTFGEPNSTPWPLFPTLELSNWTGQQAGYNVFWFLIALLFFAAIVLCTLGIRKAVRSRSTTAGQENSLGA